MTAGRVRALAHDAAIEDTAVGVRANRDTGDTDAAVDMEEVSGMGFVRTRVSGDGQTRYLALYAT